jgi:hypothetical protein
MVLQPWDNGAGSRAKSHPDGPGMKRSRMFHPCTTRLYMFSPDVFTSPYISSLKDSQPTDLYQAMDWLGI